MMPGRRPESALHEASLLQNFHEATAYYSARKSPQQHGLATERQMLSHLNLGMLMLLSVLLMMQCNSCKGTALPIVTGNFGDAAQTVY